MNDGIRARVPILLMVSGGSDSEALLELAAAAIRQTEETEDVLLRCMMEAISTCAQGFEGAELHVLHINHMLRAKAADEDEAFVVSRGSDLNINVSTQRVNIPSLAKQSSAGTEAVAREQRYLHAETLLDQLCAECGVPSSKGRIFTAHTLDDRVETFFMRSLVGTGPGGLGSIPRERGRVMRPLLSATREQLREWLRAQHPGCADSELWREDATNDDGSNFRSRVRHELIPVLEKLRPGFFAPLENTMNLILEEEQTLQSEAQSTVYRNVHLEGEQVLFPIAALKSCSRPRARRILRAVLLVANPDARLESAQIERVLEHLDATSYTTETSGGIRVRIGDGQLACFKAQ